MRSEICSRDKPIRMTVRPMRERLLAVAAGFLLFLRRAIDGSCGDHLLTDRDRPLGDERLSIRDESRLDHRPQTRARFLRRSPFCMSHFEIDEAICPSIEGTSPQNDSCWRTPRDARRLI